MKYINGISKSDVKEKSLWVVKYDTGYRTVSTISKIQEYIDECEAYMGEIRDMDWLTFEKQPEELKPFFDWYEANRNNLSGTIDDIFDEYGLDAS